MMTASDFKSLGLGKGALKAVDALGFERPTPVQEQAIPVALEGRDIIAAASTGTGKTAAFLLPSLSRLPAAKRGPRPPRMLVITPTRELAEQIAYASIRIGRAMGLYTVALYGGKPIAAQIAKTKEGCDAVIATPGRLCDLIERNAIDLDSIEVLVLDEADRMLDMGFLPDVRRIVSNLPTERQTLLFSATIDKSIQDNFQELLSAPHVIQISKKGETAARVAQYVIPVAQKGKLDLLECLLAEKGSERVIVFARTKARVDSLAKALRAADIEVETIHSDKTQGQRKHSLTEFRKGRCGVIVATDVLARGIDIPEVDYVVNYDLPDMLEDYIHRIGRTGRAGTSGFAVSFVTRDAVQQLRDIESLVKRSIPILELASYEADPSILTQASRRDKARGIDAKPKGKPKRKGHARKDPKYNYAGWGDKRTGSKKRGFGKKENEKDEGRHPDRKRPSKHAADKPKGKRKGADSATKPKRKGKRTEKPGGKAKRPKRS